MGEGLQPSSRIRRLLLGCSGPTQGTGQAVTGWGAMLEVFVLCLLHFHRSENPSYHPSLARHKLQLEKLKASISAALLVGEAAHEQLHSEAELPFQDAAYGSKQTHSPGY